MFKPKHLGLAAGLALAAAASANASIISDPSKVAPAQQVVDFNGFSPLSATSFSFSGGLGTLSSAGVSFSSASAFTYGQTNDVDLGINGSWGDGSSFLSFDIIGTMTMTISFNGLTTRSFGADWSLYEQDGDARGLTVQAFDKNGKLLESFTTARDGVDLDDNELAGTTNASFFQGIRRKQADIASITITGDRIVMDNFTYTAAVPEPEGYAMFLAGLGIMGVMARRRSGR